MISNRLLIFQYLIEDYLHTVFEVGATWLTIWFKGYEMLSLFRLNFGKSSIPPSTAELGTLTSQSLCKTFELESFKSTIKCKRISCLPTIQVQAQEFGTLWQ